MKNIALIALSALALIITLSTHMPNAASTVINGLCLILAIVSMSILGLAGAWLCNHFKIGPAYWDHN